MKPVSVIIPTFNCASFICETVESILRQTIAPNELIILDDGSSDETCSVIDKILAKQNIIQHVLFKKSTINLGPSQIRDNGLFLARNELVVYMDHDDIAEPNMLEIELARLLELNKKGDYVLIYSACSQIDEVGCIIPGIHRWRQVDIEEVLGYQFVRNQILSMSGVLLKKESVIKAGGFDSELRYSQDWDLWLRMAQLGGFGYVDQPLVKIRRHSQNTSRDIAGFLADERTILEKYDLEFIQAAINKRKLSKESNYLDFAATLFKLHHFDDAYQWIQQAIEFNPQCSSAYFYEGVYFLKKQHWDKAEQSFIKVLDKQVNDLAAFNNLGCLKALSGDWETARSYWNRAVAQAPNYFDALANSKIAGEDFVVQPSDLRFTWRELRPVLLTYQQ
jgi:glycosyltransferase involved in cell wall biosynthesis